MQSDPEETTELQGQPSESFDGRPVYVNSHEVQPVSQVPGGHLYQEDAAGSDYVLIQFNKVPTQEELLQLYTLGAQYCDSIGQQTWLTKYHPSDLSPIRQLSFVHYANIFHRSLKVDRQLQQKLSPPDERFVTSARPAGHLLHVFLALQVRPSRGPEELIDHILAHYNIPKDRLAVEGDHIRAMLSEDEIRRLTELDEVRRVEEFEEMAGFNHQSGIITGVNAAFFGLPSAPLTVGLDGAGQIVVVADSGLDTGGAATGLPNNQLLYHDTNPFFAGRVLYLQARSTASIPALPVPPPPWTLQPLTRALRADDLAGHGTHVAATVLGSYQPIWQPAAPPLPAPVTVPPDQQAIINNRTDGAAPGASLVFQSIWGMPEYFSNPVNGGRPDFGSSTDDNVVRSLYLDPYGMVFPPANTSPRIHNNSWGTPCGATQGAYNSLAEFIDGIVRQNYDYLIVRAAGNEGDRPGTARTAQIGSWSVAKNGLTVGACFSDRLINHANNPPLNMKYDRGGQVMTHDNVAHFSNRGPPLAPHNGIIKPDVVAPGVTIFSANSSARVTVSEGGDSPDHLCVWKTGTSQAAPIVSGSAAILRQALAGRVHKPSQPVNPLTNPLLTNPSAALLKALIVNGAVDMAVLGGQLAAGGPLNANPRLTGTNEPARALQRAPDDIQGFGRVDIAASVANVLDVQNCGLTEGRFFDVGPPRVDFTIGTSVKFNDVRIPRSTAAPPRRGNIKATLAWTDWVSAGLKNEMALELEFQAPAPATLNLAVSATYTNAADTDLQRRIRRMAGNNVQKLEVNNIDISAADVVVRVRVVPVDMKPDPAVPPAVPPVIPRQEYGLCWKVWYT